MTKRLGKWVKVWLEGYALTTLLTEATTSNPFEEIEIGGFTQDKHYLAGRGDANLDINGFFSDTTGETHDALNSLASGSSAVVTTIAYGSNAAPAVGDVTLGLQGQQLTYNTTPDLNGPIGIEANIKAGTDQVIEYGVLLADATITANGNGASVDQSASSSNGGVGYFHITGLSAGDTITINVQDSPDDAVWADLVTCTLDGTAIDGERVAVTGTVDRYIRAEYVVTGSSISFPIVVSFVRL